MIIGKGGFGKVWVVTLHNQKTYYALKEMSKARILYKKSVSSVLNERNILAECKSDFLINIKAAFQDRENVFLLLDLLTGGDLRFHLCYCRKFSEEQTKAFAACIILGLRAIHEKGFIHRDIKPENIVFDEKGFLRITDFGIARKMNPENAKETSGTPGYMAPEVMCRMNHGFEVDFYALGIICYECMLGKRPYSGKSRKEIRDQILAKQVLIREEEVPPGWSEEAVGFINGLIQRKPSRRLGVNGIGELMDHPWFAGYDWKALEERRMTPPFTPNIQSVFEYLRSITEDDSDAEELAEQELNIRRKSVQDLFQGYELAPEKSLETVPAPLKKSQSSSRQTYDSRVSRNESTRESWHTERMRKTLSSSVAPKALASIKARNSQLPLGSHPSTRLDLRWRGTSPQF